MAAAIRQDLRERSPARWQKRILFLKINVLRLPGRRVPAHIEQP
jgi:hypothetical protein